jgi:hypothetical protein
LNETVHLNLVSWIAHGKRALEQLQQTQQTLMQVQQSTGGHDHQTLHQFFLMFFQQDRDFWLFMNLSLGSSAAVNP